MKRELTLEEFRAIVRAGRRPPAGTRISSSITGRVDPARARITKAAGTDAGRLPVGAAAARAPAETEEQRAYLAELRQMGIEPY